MKNIHVLPTTQDSWLCLKDGELVNANDGGCMLGYDPPRWLTQHIYITNSEEIKEGDWCIELETNRISKSDFRKDILKSYIAKHFKKIILTTDQDLINDGVQSIDDDFLEWFIKNPSCEKVIVEEEDYSQKCRECGETVKRGYNCTKKCFMKSGNFIPTDKNIKYKTIIPKEPKQETLEEAAERYAESNQYDLECHDEGGYLGIDTKIFAKKLIDFTNKWFEQFKKK